LKATRLMEVYVMRLVPALQYLCQKLEFFVTKDLRYSLASKVENGKQQGPRRTHWRVLVQD
jgi:hypothetical protein